MKNKNIAAIIWIALTGSVIFTLASCTQNPSSPALNGSDIIFWTALDNSGAHSVHNNIVPVSFSTVDSIYVQSAGFGASNFELRSDLSDSMSSSNLSVVQIRPDQFLLSFDGNGGQYIGERIAQAGTYNSARFDLHTFTGSNDSLALALGPNFSSLFGIAGNKTIVIKGNIISAEQSLPFTYISTISGSERITFDSPLIVAGDGESIRENVTFRTALAFTSGGMMMDPRDPNNHAAIDANLRMAIIAMK